jgi:L-seryl-tRNA(Ser) seleniumtransferase
MINRSNRKLLKEITSVSRFMDSPSGEKLTDKFGSGIVKHILKGMLEKTRKEILNGSETLPSINELTEKIELELLRMTSPEGRKVINATGILLHTALGRAPYADNARDMLSVFNGYSLLQAALEDGKRSRRDGMIESMICELTGCEAATIINNNAEGTMLILNELSAGKEAVISRGQLVEIGGSFRMPDVMKQSGADMVEIGTTNRTHLKDYSAAVNEKTGVVVHVHTSNYKIRGFSGTPDIKEICELRRKEFSHIPVIDDLGSGGLVSLSEFGLADGPLVRDSIRAGADLVCFSGDKLICGPQCGIICGKREFVERIRENSFARMFRVDKMTLAVMEATLIHFINGTYRKEIPFYRMLSADIADLEICANNIKKSLENLTRIKVAVADSSACVGSGSIPDENIPDKVVKITFDKSVSLDKLSKKLRYNFPSVFARITDDSLLFSMRTLLPGDEQVLIKDLPLIFSLQK